jgi:Copper amine oxidase, enzyme domain
VPGSVGHADWSLSWAIPALKGGGLVIRKANYKGTRVLYEAGAPFVLVDYHANAPIFKDGLGWTTCGNGLDFTALTPTAPNATSSAIPPSGIATNDNQYDPSTNPGGAVMVEKHAAELSESAHLVLWTKLQCGNYQYIHRWEFGADGSIHVYVGLGGKLWTAHPGPDGLAGGRAHIHNFYFRLDFDIGTFANNLVQEFAHTNLSALAGDQWTDLKSEGKRTVNPAQFTKWRVVNKTAKPNGQLRSYELIGGSEGPPDGTYSTGDLWVVRYKPSGEDGSNVGCNDSVLANLYAGGGSPESADGQDVVVWYCLRTHHMPRHRGEEDKVLPYEFIGFRIEPRDFLDHTPAGLYPTTPTSP